MPELIETVLKTIRGSDCEKLVKLRGNEISISGVKIGIPDINIEVGAFTNKYVEFYKVNSVLASMDSSQYLLCRTIEDLPVNDPLRRDCLRMRLQTILGFNQLHALLALKDDEQFKDEIETWVQYMNDLSKLQIEGLMIPVPPVRPTPGPGGGGNQPIGGRPSPAYVGGRGAHRGAHDFDVGGVTISTGGFSTKEEELKRIASYQGIDEQVLEKALDTLG